MKHHRKTWKWLQAVCQPMILVDFKTHILTLSRYFTVKNVIKAIIRSVKGNPSIPVTQKTRVWSPLFVQLDLFWRRCQKLKATAWHGNFKRGDFSFFLNYSAVSFFFVMHMLVNLSRFLQFETRWWQVSHSKFGLPWSWSCGAIQFRANVWRCYPWALFVI